MPVTGTVTDTEAGIQSTRALSHFTGIYWAPLRAGHSPGTWLMAASDKGSWFYGAWCQWGGITNR